MAFECWFQGKNWIKTPLKEVISHVIFESQACFWRLDESSKIIRICTYFMEIWSLGVYLLAPTIGAIVGVLFYRILRLQGWSCESEIWTPPLQGSRESLHWNMKQWNYMLLFHKVRSQYKAYLLPQNKKLDKIICFIW